MTTDRGTSVLVLAIALFMPIRAHTPGLVRPMSQAEVCAVRWGTDSRAVTPGMKRTVFALYGIPQDQRSAYQVDHLVPRSAAGSDSVANLWPQPWPEARLKDRLERTLHRLVCVAGTVSLKEAQRAFRDWRRGYERYVGPVE